MNKTIIERILAKEKIRSIILDENTPYPEGMKKNYPAGGNEGPMNQMAVDNKEHPTNKDDINSNVGDATPSFTSTTGGAAKGLNIPKAMTRSGQMNLRGSVSGKAPSALGKIVKK